MPSFLPFASRTITGRDAFALAIFAIALLYAAAQLSFNVFTLDTWMDEGKYLMRGYWYVTGTIAPYSDIDPTFYMPLIFYEDGLAQLLFGIGYLPGRVLAVIFALACFVLVYLVGQRIGRSRLAGAAAVVLAVCSPVTLTYFATATPYAVVSFLSLLLIFILYDFKSRRAGYALAGLIMWAILFTRPNMMPIGLIPAGWALLIEPSRKIESAAIAFAAFTIPTTLAFLLFGQRLFDVVLDVPGISHIATALGAQAGAYSKIVSSTFSQIDRPVGPGEPRIFFTDFFIKPYFAVACVTVVAITLRIMRLMSESERNPEPMDLILVYFWIMVVSHFYASLSFCVDCILPYANYFIPVGALAAASLLGELSYWPKRSISISSVFSCILLVALATRVFPDFPALLRPGNDAVRARAEELSTKLRPILPASKMIFVLSEDVAASQAVWLAGGAVEPISIYLPFTFRAPKPAFSEPERKRLSNLIWSAGYWDEEGIRHAIAARYSTLLIERRPTYHDPIASTLHNGMPFGDLVEGYFRLAATVEMRGSAYELYDRRD